MTLISVSFQMLKLKRMKDSLVFSTIGINNIKEILVIYIVTQAMILLSPNAILYYLMLCICLLQILKIVFLHKNHGEVSNDVNIISLFIVSINIAWIMHKEWDNLQESNYSWICLIIILASIVQSLLFHVLEFDTTQNQKMDQIKYLSDLIRDLREFN